MKTKNPTIDAMPAHRNPIPNKNHKSAKIDQKITQAAHAKRTKGINAIHNVKLKNLSTIIFIYGTQIIKTVLYLSKDLLHHLCIDYTFCKLDRLVLLEVLNLLMLLPVSFLLSEKLDLIMSKTLFSRTTSNFAPS